MVVAKLFIYRTKAYLSFLLSLSITGIIWYALIYMLTNSGYIRNYPGLFNKGLPFYYLIAPCLYLYIRGSLNEAHAVFHKADLLHLLLTIPAIISVLPYNLLDHATQQVVVNKVVDDVQYVMADHPYIVGPWHWFAFPLSASIYTFLQFRITFKASKLKLKPTYIINWIYAFTGTCGFIFLGMVGINLTVLLHINDAWSILHESRMVIMLCVSMLILSGMFFFNPQLLYGFIPQRRNEGNNMEPSQIQQDEKQPAGHLVGAKVRKIDLTLVTQVESFINSGQHFRKPGFTLNELAFLIEVPGHKLSELFNNYYKLNFNAYINNLRVDYIKNRLEMGDWKQFTLEAIAYDAGFSSRNSFFLAFKRSTGVTPSTFLAAVKEKNP